ncbi:MAG: hypothetical protein A2788_02055 [Candidatus Abawacabacteria bacterium RIFCSPHIGHO2_01_FULL_46_8]|uniref:Uncharacterized protein n=1 Tax=Candidatus Abawacabacteria bacterium RIFCSPHIGHO2_01_FULL_46_8 TaxID=1817815 RepID=A0A1F4XKC5_9BACT|nr:MAG: hypothetical protein A2788_02055 [Candidatus Abawacabacteria bacterium RIFCSPHIGHO2_01_FULL_46_8]
MTKPISLKPAQTLNNQALKLCQERPRLFNLLIALDLFWWLAATIYDWQKLVSTPWYLLPFLPICPIYPLLLAIAFICLKRGRQIPAPLAIFTFMGAASYGIMAYIFYPLYMSATGLDSSAIGNMAWVTFYALQSYLLLPYLKIWPGWIIILATYFFSKDIIDLKFQQFSYLITPTTPGYVISYSFIAILLIHLTLLYWLTNQQRQTPAIRLANLASSR